MAEKAKDQPLTNARRRGGESGMTEGGTASAR